MPRRRLLLIFTCLLTLAQPAASSAGELAGGGVFLDLPGCLTSSPCAATVSAYPLLRLTVGGGFIAAHLDILNVVPHFSALWLPYMVVQVPLEISDTLRVTPQVGWAPLLATAGTPPGSVDWVLKIGNHLQFGELGIFVDVLFTVPFSAVPSISMGALVIF